MKRLVIVLFVMALLCMSTLAFAEPNTTIPGVSPTGKNGKFAVGLDPYWLITGLINGGFGLGGFFEYGFLNFLSAKLTIGYLRNSFTSLLSAFTETVSIFAILGGFRGYFLQTSVNGPFFGLCGGGYIIVWKVSASGLSESTSNFYPGFLIDGGYRFNLMKDKGFFFEPTIGALITIPTRSNDMPLEVFGLYYTLNIGWVF